MAYEIIPISNRFWRIEDGPVRCFLFAGAERALLVDSGQSGGDLRAVVSGLTDLPVLLVNTHADPDHTACNGQFDAVYLHPAEFGLYRSLNGMDHRLLPLWEGDVLDLGGETFEVVAMPGHTPGSITLLNRNARILVGGDGIQNGGIFFDLNGVQRSLQAHVAAMERLCRLHWDAFDLVYPSHAEVPLPKTAVPELIRDARAVLDGACPGQDMEFHGAPYRNYVTPSAAFLCNRGRF